MRAEGIDILVIHNDNQYLDGYVRYFTDFPAETAYPITVQFPVKYDMTMISHGGPPKPAGPPAWAVRRGQRTSAQPYFRTAYPCKYDAEEAVKLIKRRKDRKVGIVGMGAMHAAFYVHLNEHLPSVELVEASDLVDRIKAVKSEDELVYVRLAAQTQDIVFAAMPSIVRLGEYEYQVRAEIARRLMDLGSEEHKVNEFLASKAQSPRAVPTRTVKATCEASSIQSRREHGVSGEHGHCLHPLAANEQAFALCCDDYLVKDGPEERLHSAPQAIL